MINIFSETNNQESSILIKHSNEVNRKIYIKFTQDIENNIWHYDALIKKDNINLQKELLRHMIDSQIETRMVVKALMWNHRSLNNSLKKG